MRAVVLAFVVTLGVIVATAQPVFRFFDGRAARNRLRERPHRVRRRSEDGVEHVCARVLVHLARGVRNGQSSAEALALAVLREPRSAAWFAPVAVAHSDGVELTAAVAVLADAPTPVRRAAAQIGVAAATGALRAETIDRAAAMMAAIARHREEASASAAHVRLSLRMLSILPVATVVATLALHRPAREILYRSPSIVAGLVAAAALNVAGRAWMRRLAGDLG